MTKNDEVILNKRQPKAMIIRVARKMKWPKNNTRL